jgi:glycosyltransferase involved in cell wall biosynthesis
VSELVIGYPSTCYGTSRVSHGLPTRPYGVSYRKVRRLPLHRLPWAPPYWDYVCRVFPTLRVDALHLWNRVCTSRIPWVTSFELEYPRYFGKVPAKAFDRAYRQMASDHCRLLLPMSIAAKRHFLSRVPDRYLTSIEPKVRVFTGGIAVPETVLRERAAYLRQRRSEFRLGFVGRDFWRKGGPAAIQAVSMLRRQYPHVRLFMVADPDSDTYVAQIGSDIRCSKIHELRASTWVEFHRELPNNEVLAELARCDILIFPTLDESLGWIVLEAKALGLPVVSTNTVAIPELVEDGVEGMLIRLPLDADGRWTGLSSVADTSAYEEAIYRMGHGIVESVERLIRDESLRLSMGQAAQSRFRRQYQDSVAAQQLAALLRAAV